MSNINWWENFYENEYCIQTLTSETKPVYNFISQFLPNGENLTIFDQCCGKGHLSYEFAKHGYSTLGIDSSKTFIEFANNNYASENCKFVLGDAKTFVSKEAFDVAINWYTSFGYDESDEENFKMIRALSENLKTGGQFFISTFNPDFINVHFEKYLDRSFEYNGQFIKCIKESFIENNMLKSWWHFEFPDGCKEKYFGQTKIYSIDELNSALLRYNLYIEHVYGSLNFDKLTQDFGSIIIYGRKYDVNTK